MNGPEMIAEPYRSLVSSLVELIKTEYDYDLVSVAVFRFDELHQSVHQRPIRLCNPLRPVHDLTSDTSPPTDFNIQSANQLAGEWLL